MSHLDGGRLKKFLLIINHVSGIGLMLILLFFGAVAQASVCERTPEVVDAIEEALQRSCADLTEGDLMGILYLDVYLEDSIDMSSEDFKGMGALKMLAIYGISVSVLPRDIFEPLVSLNNLDISIELREVPALSNLTELEFLILEENLLESIPPQAFVGLKKLKYLSLSGNRLTEIPQTLVQDLPQLTLLDLSANRFRIVKKEAFVGFDNLEELFLNENRYELALESGAFSHLQSLKTLGLNKNWFSLNKESFLGLGSLSKLELRRSHLTLEQLRIVSSSGLAKVKDLDISENDLQVLDGDSLSRFVGLEKLSCNYCNLHSFSVDIFAGNPELAQIYLQNNWLTTLTVAPFEGLKRLEYLDLWWARVKKLEVEKMVVALPNVRINSQWIR